MSWTAAEAKRHFSQVLKDSKEAPQVVLVRGKPSGVMISYEKFLQDKTHSAQKTTAQWLEELAVLAPEEADLDLPARKDRPAPFGDDWE